MTQPNETCAAPARRARPRRIAAGALVHRSVDHRAGDAAGLPQELELHRPACRAAKVGDYVTGYAGNVPVVVVRNDKGLAAFVNVCRHRRHLVMKGRGNATLMQCGYHAWTYDLTGGLRRAPRSAAEPDFRLEDFPLLPIRAEALGPFVFVNLDPERADGAGLLRPDPRHHCQERRGARHNRAPQPRRMEGARQLEGDARELPRMLPLRRRPSGLQRGDRRAARRLHPGLARLVLQPGRSVRPRWKARAKIELYDVRGEVARVAVPLPVAEPHHQHQPGLPRTCRSMSGLPDGPNATTGFSEQFFGPGVSEDFAQALIAFNKQVALEDDDADQFRAARAFGGLPERGRFLTKSEQLVIHFQKMIVRALNGASPFSLDRRFSGSARAAGSRHARHSAAPTLQWSVRPRQVRARALR